MDLFGGMSGNPAQNCSFKACKCRDKDTQRVESIPLKQCSACGITAYCSKEAQKRDWARHKHVCSKLRPYKDFIMNHPDMKSSLDSISFEMPNIVEEYKKVYPSLHLFHYLFIETALQATRDMLKENLEMMSIENDPDPQNLLKRWMEVGPDLFDFISTADAGDVWKTKPYRLYSPPAPQQFRNTSFSCPTHIQNGKNIVDIGFVDFGIIFESVDSIDPAGEPVQVLAYDKDPFCIAKTLVMHEMILDESVQPRSVVEVWLSSLWSVKTFEAFKRAVRIIIDGKGASLDKSVRDILNFWRKQKKMTSKVALAYQEKAMINRLNSDFAMTTCSLESETDRVKFLRYSITKALYEDATTVIGSVVMNTEKESLGIKQAFECCFEAVPYRIHMVMERGGIFERSVTFFERNMSKYMNLIREKVILFSPKLSTLTSDNEAVLGEMKDAKPYLISWSNVVDYIKPEDFHRIAKKISCIETAHFLHFVNWTTRVYGADAMDLNINARLQMYAAGLQLCDYTTILSPGIRKGMPSHFRNLCGAVLGRKFINSFLQYFFDGEDVKCACFNGNEGTPLPQMFPLTRTNNVAQ